MGLKSCDRHTSGVFVYSGDACPYCEHQKVSAQQDSQRQRTINTLTLQLREKQIAAGKLVDFIDAHKLFEKQDSYARTLAYVKALEARVAQLERANSPEVK